MVSSLNLLLALRLGFLWALDADAAGRFACCWLERDLRILRGLRAWRLTVGWPVTPGARPALDEEKWRILALSRTRTASSSLPLFELSCRRPWAVGTRREEE